MPTASTILFRNTGANPAGEAEAVFHQEPPHGIASATLSPNTAPNPIGALCAGRVLRAARPALSLYSAGVGSAASADLFGEGRA